MDNDSTYASVCLNFRALIADFPMQPQITPADDPVLAPIGNEERIQALDVVRGFALLGIFLMNVEWFNRPIADLESGMPLHASGIDYFAGWMIYTFVRGKFWTMFSLLFGMGFAVMLGRAERARRDFVRPWPPVAIAARRW